MELRHFRYFIAVAEELHFRRAAERLSIAQPPLSQQILKLEDELQVKLFDRTRRRVELTPAGQVFLEEARRVLRQVDRATLIARRAAGIEPATLIVGYIPSADLSVLPPVLSAFKQRSADVHIGLHNLTIADQVRALHEERIDIGFLRPFINAPGLTIEPILRESLVLALPENHPLALLREVPLKALANHPHIIFRRQSAPYFHDLIVGFLERARIPTPAVEQTETIQNILSLVAARFGISLLAASVMNITRTGVVYRKVLERVPEIEMAIAYRSNDPSPILAEFLDVTREMVRKRLVPTTPGGPPLSSARGRRS